MRYDGELWLCGRFLLVFHTEPFTLTYFVTGYPIGADITATWTLHINHVSFTISGLKCTETGRELGREGLIRLVDSSFTFLSAVFYLFGYILAWTILTNGLLLMNETVVEATYDSCPVQQ